MLTSWHLVGTFQGFIAINLVLAANLFLMRQYFLTIPKDFEEAAKLDGAGYFKTYWRVMLPLATPALAAVTILTFQGMWNEFFWSLIILGFGDPDRYTLQLGHRSVPLPVPDALAAADGRERDRDPADRAHLRRLPALLHLRRRLERCEGMTVSVSTSLRGALRDFYEHSWRLVALNGGLSLCVLAILAAASFWAPAVMLLLLLGPLAAALMHCAVRWCARGSSRSATPQPVSRCTGAAGSSSLHSPAWSSSPAWPVSAPTAAPRRSRGRSHSCSRTCSRSSASTSSCSGRWRSRSGRSRSVRCSATRCGRYRPPGRRARAGLALLLVNVLGALAALLPLLTLTVAYSFLAAARFALPPQPLPEA